MLRFSASLATTALIAISVILPATDAAAQTCKAEQIFAIVDETGARLRQLNAEAQPRIVARLREIGAKRGWPEADIDTRGRQLVDDVQTRDMDRQAGLLLDKLGRLGDDEQTKGQPLCERLSVAKTTSAQLIEVTRARAAHVSAKLAVALEQGAAAATKTAKAEAKGQAKSSKSQAVPAQPATNKGSSQSPNEQPQSAGQQESRSPATPPQQARPPNAASWSANTSVTDARPVPQAMASLPRPLEPGELGFSSEEIRAAGRGFFGSISAGLASVIDYAFVTYGKPTGYILGNEGGGAFLAGLRYGDGQLVTKLGGERKIYWQGPSVGYDVGVAGSRVMVLVYNIKEHEQIFTRFLGVDGSAYLVGGVGITFLKRGPLVLAPIRTGLGLRLGANVGYLKFTPKPSLNPF